MAGPAPVEVGARGTIGSLVSQEIEYFKKFEVDRRDTSHLHKPKLETADIASKGELPKSKSRLVSPRKKKKAIGSTAGGGKLPNICAAVEVAETRLDMMVSVGYRNLKTDAKRLPRD